MNVTNTVGISTGRWMKENDFCGTVAFLFALSIPKRNLERMLDWQRTKIRANLTIASWRSGGHLRSTQRPPCLTLPAGKKDPEGWRLDLLAKRT